MAKIGVGVREEGDNDGIISELDYMAPLVVTTTLIGIQHKKERGKNTTLRGAGRGNKGGRQGTIYPHTLGSMG